ncbi:hypothetical protein PVA44_07760 (plasmid) [Entomospira nematocerorum]|uniref:Uncharacterized protein n=1 Tax=Entomospira nematocerorum TaxID=2719987 RepID=A0A968KVX5_9SPIO|nr:hypothetical protein [Entomospira nematocera]NIZ47808.1 hypothetical protein [Entomospira nematocera]WDI34741.1 hypothetical protein PVA44_07760 [Entomospira nematocera]
MSSSQIKLAINRTFVDGFLSVSMSYSITEFVAGFAVVLLDTPQMSWLRPFGYEEIAIYYGDELLLTGRIEKVERSQHKSLHIEGRSLPAVLIDASMEMPGQFHDVDLHMLLSELGKPYGLSVVSEIAQLPVYASLTAGVDTKAFAFANCCAENDNIFLSSSPAGEIILRHYNFTQVHNTFVAGDHGYLDAQVSFDGSQRFSSLTLVAQSEDNLELRYTIDDPSISIHRPLVETAEAPDLATLEHIAKRRLALSIANSIKMSLKLNGWHRSQSADRLLRVGDIIQIEDPSLGLNDRSAFVIAGLEMTLSSSEMQMSLQLALPSLYSEEPLEGEHPWQ